MILITIFLSISQMVMMQEWCCIIYPCGYICPGQFATPKTIPRTSTSIIVTTTPTKRVIPKTSQPTVPVTKRTTAIPTTQPFYSDWTAWSCTESCGGCGIERRTRKCLSIPTACTEETEEFNDQSCNQHPCPFGKRTCCVNYRLEQMKERFVCIP